MPCAAKQPTAAQALQQAPPNRSSSSITSPGGRKRCRSSSGREEGSAPKRPVLGLSECIAGQWPSPLPSPGGSASGFRGVTYHQRTGRYESHIWCGKKQVYLGGWDTGSQAALAYDIAALRLRGEGTTLNFHPTHYRGTHRQLAEHGFEEVVAALRALSRGGSAARQLSSRFRGVSRHQKGKWEARIGTVAGKRYLYLGLHDSETAAAAAYDRAAIREKGVDAGTNFHLAEYAEELDPTQLSEALQRGIITGADMALRQQVAAVAAAGGHPGVLLSSAAEGAVAARSPAAASSVAATQSAPGTSDLAGLLYECVCLEGESPTSVLPGALAAAAGKADAWQPDACFC